MTIDNVSDFIGIFQKKNRRKLSIVNLVCGLTLKAILFIICFNMAFFPPWLPQSSSPIWADEQAQIAEIISDWLASESNGFVDPATTQMTFETDKKKKQSSTFDLSKKSKEEPSSPALAVSGSADQDNNFQRKNYEKSRHSNESYTRDSHRSRSDQVRNSLISEGTGAVAETIEKRLDNRGKVRLNLNLNDDDRLDWSGDLLLPLWEDETSMIYSQIGGRSMENKRRIANLGLGQRFFLGDQLMLGYNGFYDYDLTRHHSRIGVGAEIAHDWIKLSANGYWPLSDWKGSDDFDDYNQERPARGWDLRTKAYIPYYRQIALTGDYTRWYGNASALGGKPVKDPEVVSYGLEYTPFPLMTTYARQQRSNGSQKNTEFGLTFNWNFGMSAAEQFDSANVEKLHSFSRNRYDFVDRENKMILAYRNTKNTVCGLSFINFPAHLQIGVPVTLQISLSCDGQPWANEPINWSFLGQGFNLPDQVTYTGANGIAEVTFTPDNIGQLTIRASGMGMVGEQTATVDNIPVEIDLVSSKSNIGIGETGLLTLSLTSDGAPLANANIVWSISSGNSLAFLANEILITDASGQATADLTGLADGAVSITATANVNGQQFSASVTVGVLTNPLDLNLKVANPVIAVNEVTALTFTIKQGEVVPIV